MARHQRYAKKKLSHFTIFSVLVFSVVLCGTLTYKKSVLKAQSKEYEIQLEELKKQQEQLKEEAEELEQFESYVDSDEYVEEIARERLGLVYKNEIIFEPED